MKIAAIQTDIAWGDPQKNIRRAMELVDEAGDVDIVVFPEMFTTGFAVSEEAASESDDSPSLHAMVEKAAERKVAIAGSIAVRTSDKGEYRNRFYFVKPDGTIEYYDKKHLFSFGGEGRKFTGGNERKIVEYKGFRILLQVCYDLRFPVFSRNHFDSEGKPEYDLALYVANWPERRIDAWDTLLKARAIENQCYVVGVNRAGDDPDNSYVGHSAIIDFNGKILTDCKQNEEIIIVGELDMVRMEAYREFFPAMKDAD